MCGELARLLADSYILPFDVQSFTTAIEDYANRIDVHHGSLMRDHGLAEGLGNYFVVFHTLLSSQSLFVLMLFSN